MHDDDGEPMEVPVESLRVSLDHRTLARLETLALLQTEALPGLPYDEHDAIKQALERGLDHMIRELLVRTERRERREH